MAEQAPVENNVHEIPSSRPLPSSGHGGNGNGTDIRDRLARLETKMDYLATREDLVTIKALIAEKEANHTKWMISIIATALISVLIALIRTFIQ